MWCDFEQDDLALTINRWNLRKDTQFNTFVESATWEDTESKWTIHTKEGDTFKAKFFLLNTGFAAKRYIPDWKGIDTFRGTFMHPSYWPHEEPDLKGKKIAVIGTGSTGIQIATDLAPIAGELVVFQRSPNTSLPMRQVNYEHGEQSIPRELYPAHFALRNTTFGGFTYSFANRNTFDDSIQKRLETYENLWARGDFRFWLGTYHDTLFSPAANREAYLFWRDKTRARIDDPRARDILAPMEPAYAFGTKRISLEQSYFEIYNEPHVHLVDVNATPIEEITARGIRTSGSEWELDHIICATGFDSVTGGLAQIDIRGPSGESLKEHWAGGTYTYLGMAVSGFPNMFFTYGPQAPTAFCNGPTCAQLQGDWIADVMGFMGAKGVTKIEAERESEEKWREDVHRFANASLVPGTKSVSLTSRPLGLMRPGTGLTRLA